jgi:hypothetical protein
LVTLKTFGEYYLQRIQISKYVRLREIRKDKAAKNQATNKIEIVTGDEREVDQRTKNIRQAGK